MKRKSILLTLISILLISVVGFFGCKNASTFDDNESGEVVISGLTVQDEITVNAGTLVSIERPIVTDSEGNLLDVFASVVDKEGAFVEVKAGSFFVMDNGGYTLTYSVYTSDKVVHKATTTIHVIGNNYISLNMDQVVFEDDTVKFDFSHKLSNASFTYSVKYGTTDVAVTDGQFVCDNAGFYDCTITAIDDYHPAESPMIYTFQVYAYPNSEYENFGMVEEFNQYWEEIRDLSGFGRQGWYLTSSEECGVKDHNGSDSYFAATDMEVGMTMNIFYLNPLHDSDYFANLVSEGYTAVEFWIYVDGTSSYYLENYEIDSSNYEYIRSFGYLNPYTWKKISIPLVGTEKTWVKTFADSVDYYSTQIMHFLRFSNGDKTVNSKIYLDDICAVKEADEITAKDNYSVPSVGDTYNFDDMFNVSSLDYEVVYTVSSNHNAYASINQGDEYQFTSNGTYTVTAVPARCDYVTESTTSLTFEVNDEISMPNTYGIREREDDTIDVYMQSVQIGTNPISGLDVIIRYQGNDLEDYSQVIVGPDGNEVSLDANDEYFTANKDGVYTIYYSAEYELGDLTCTTYKEFTLDVWSEENKYILGLASDMACCRIDSGTAALTSSYGDYVAGGLSGKKYVINSNTNGAIVAIKPLYSKQYYLDLKEEIMADANYEESDLNALIEVYVKGKVGAVRSIKTSVYKSTNINSYSIGAYSGSSSSPDYKRGYYYSQTSAENTWANTATDLTTFIDVYDTFVENYEFVSARSEMNASYPYRFNAFDYYTAFWTVTEGTQVFFTDFELSRGKVGYTAEIYKETATNSNTYTKNTIDYVAKEGASVSANVIDYEGYFYDDTVSGTVDEATVASDGSTVLKLYYRRLPKYKTEYYVQQLNDAGTGYEYVLQGNFTTYTYAKAGTTVTADTSISFPYCRVNTEISIASSTVPNSDELVLKVYYDTYAKDLGLLNSAVTDGTFDLNDELDNSFESYDIQLKQIFIDGSEISLDKDLYISDSGVVDYSTLDGIYVVKATLKTNSSSEEVIKFEAYNGNEYTWNTVSSSTVDSTYVTQIMQRLQSSEEITLRKIGLKDYFEFSVDNGVYRSFSFLPAHSYTYYNRLRGQGVELSFKFKREGTSGWAQLYNFSTTNVSGSLGAESNKWYTVSFSVEDLLDKYWSTLLDPSANYSSWTDRGNIAMMVVIASAKNTVTVGDFTMKKVSSFDVNEYEVEDLQSFDLTTFMSKNVKLNIESLEENYDIVTKLIGLNGEEINVINKEDFDLTTLTKAYYDVIFYAGSGSSLEEIWSCGIDIYDSTDGVVFNNVLEDNIGYVKAYYKNDAVDSSSIIIDNNAYSITFPAAPTTNTCRSIMVLPLHSKLYYQQYYGQNLYLTFDIVFTCADGTYNETAVTAGTSVTTKQFHDTYYHKAMACGFTYNLVIKLDTIIDDWSGYTNFVYNIDSNSGATIKTVGLGAGILTAKISNIKLSQPNNSATTTTGYLSGKTVAVIGDSISTWVDGVSASSYYPSVSNNSTYNGDITLNDMWWKKVADQYDMIVSRNNSVSGRTAAGTAESSNNYGGNEGINLSNDRASDVKPNYLFIFLGTNDRTLSSIGTVSESTFTFAESYNPVYEKDSSGNSYVTNKIETFVKAYARIVYDAQRTYPGIKIYCLNVPKSDSNSLTKTQQINEAISSIATHYGVEVVDLFTAFGDNYMSNTLDNLHPNKAGQEIMANAVIAKLNSDYTAE